MELQVWYEHSGLGPATDRAGAAIEDMSDPLAIEEELRSQCTDVAPLPTESEIPALDKIFWSLWRLTDLMLSINVRSWPLHHS